MSSGLYQIRDKNLDTTLDLTRLKPYGDTMNDGKVQTSFALPVKDDDKGAAAAVMLAQKMGLADPNVALRQKLDENFTFYVVYGSLTHSINYNEIVVQTVTDETMDMHENDEFLKERLGRKMVVIGASTGTDAHTVGIDAIMNRKGFAGHYGLERYDMIEAYNLGSQVPNEEFLRKAAEVNADVLLVSQTVTQKDVHIQNLTELIELREILETEAVKLAVQRATDEEIKAIERADWRMDEPGISPDEMQSRDFEFHNALAMASGNSILTELIKAIRKVIAGKLEDSTEALPISGEGSLLHKKIIRAVKERNLEEALEAMEEYLIITDYKA